MISTLVTLGRNKHNNMWYSEKYNMNQVSRVEFQLNLLPAIPPYPTLQIIKHSWL